MKVSASFEPAIVAREMTRMVDFYRGALGMRLFSIDDISSEAAARAGLADVGYSIARLDTDGGDRLKIVVPRHTVAVQPSTAWVLERPGLAYLTFVVPDVRAVVEAIRRAGGRLRTGNSPVAFRPGVVELAFAEDPEGNCLEFVQRNDLGTYRPGRAVVH